MTTVDWICVGIAGVQVGAYVFWIGHEAATRAWQRKWRESKQRGPGGCVHNVVSEREFPKGDRIVCEDCGESDPSFTALED